MHKLFVLLVLGAASMCAQSKNGPPRNLQVLTSSSLPQGMRAAVSGTGMQCDGCHEADRASDAKETKLTARKMFTMVNDINAKFPDGKEHVTCYTCHRGQQDPVSAPPAAK